MGQYKVPQNVEAEDHILGPLTFKQFIYALIGAGWAFVSFAIFRSVPILVIAIGAPPAILFFLLAFYNRDGQDFEHLLIAMVSFFATPRTRIWAKNDLIETFHVSPTVHAAEVNQRNRTQVLSELEKLSTLIDSRGWNQPVNVDTGSHLTMPTATHQDRLVAPPPTPHAPGDDVAAKPDMLDMQRSPLAQNLAALLQQAAEDVRQEAVTQMSTPSARLAPAGASISGVTAPLSNDILRLATQNDDLSVAQVAAQATRMAPVLPVPNGGVAQ